VSKGPDAFRTISEVADDLGLPQHVLRFWETRFGQIRPLKRGGGRRYYRPDDVDLLRGIKELLYGEGYTIKGVQRILKEQGPRFVIMAGRGDIDALQARSPQREPGFDHEDDDGDNIAPEAPSSFDERDYGDDELEDADDQDEDELPLVSGPPPSPARRLVEGIVSSVRPQHPATPGRADLTEEERTQLRATLAELLECKRLLDQVR